MKKVIMLLITFSVYMYAGLFGFFGDIASSAIGSSLVGGGAKVAYVNKLKKRADQVNSYLWHMHETKKYVPSYKFYVKWLENYLNQSGYDDINFWDTIAWTYKDHGDKKTALKIYRTRILPWVDIWYNNDKKGINKNFRAKWAKNYKEIQK